MSQGHRDRPATGSRRKTPSYTFTSTKLCTVSLPTSGAPCEPGEATTCTLSVAYGLGATRRASGACSARTSPIFHSFDQILKLAGSSSPIQALARQRGVVVRSSHVCDLDTALGRRPRPLGMHLAPPKFAPGVAPRGNATPAAFAPEAPTHRSTASQSEHREHASFGGVAPNAAKVFSSVWCPSGPGLTLAGLTQSRLVAAIVPPGGQNQKGAARRLGLLPPRTQRRPPRRSVQYLSLRQTSRVTQALLDCRNVYHQILATTRRGHTRRGMHWLRTHTNTIRHGATHKQRQASRHERRWWLRRGALRGARRVTTEPQVLACRARLAVAVVCVE